MHGNLYQNVNEYRTFESFSRKSGLQLLQKPQKLKQMRKSNKNNCKEKNCLPDVLFAGRRTSRDGLASLSSHLVPMANGVGGQG